MDGADAFWAARIASRFSNEMIRAIVDAARLSDPNVADTLADVIIRRRDKVVAYWITKTNPLDGISIDDSTGARELGFENAALRLGVVSSKMALYTGRWSQLDNTSGQTQPVGAEFTIENHRVRIAQDVWGPPDASGSRYGVLKIATTHPHFPEWKKPIVITVRERAGALEVVGRSAHPLTLRAAGRCQGSGFRRDQVNLIPSDP
jgi:hypothetical protein